MSQMDMGNKLSEHRQNRNMTQEELAGRIGVTPQALSKWERGQSLPDIALLVDLCRVLGVSADYLLGTEGRKLTENGDNKSEDEIRKNLRSCLEPLELVFGRELVPVFMDTSYIKNIVGIRKHLSTEGILMPLVRVRDCMQLNSGEFMILSYQRILYREETSERGETACRYIMEKLEQIVRERYAEILNRDLIKELVDNLQIRYPALITGTVPERISYGLLLEVMKRFMERGNSCLYLARMIEIIDNELCQNPAASADELVCVLVRELENGDDFRVVMACQGK